MDKILMHGMEFIGYHGVYEEEKLTGQKFVVDVEIYTCFLEAAETDSVEKTVSYAEIYEKIKYIVEEQRFDLIETLSQKIADMLLKEQGVFKVLVRVKKPQAPIKGCFDYMGVEIIRG